jgi:hypothetical protein
MKALPIYRTSLFLLREKVESEVGITRAFVTSRPNVLEYFRERGVTSEAVLLTAARTEFHGLIERMTYAMIQNNDRETAETEEAPTESSVDVTIEHAEPTLVAHPSHGIVYVHAENSAKGRQAALFVRDALGDLRAEPNPATLAQHQFLQEDPKLTGEFLGKSMKSTVRLGAGPGLLSLSELLYALMIAIHEQTHGELSAPDGNRILGLLNELTAFRKPYDVFRSSNIRAWTEVEKNGETSAISHQSLREFAKGKYEWFGRRVEAQMNDLTKIADPAIIMLRRQNDHDLGVIK